MSIARSQMHKECDNCLAAKIMALREINAAIEESLVIDVFTPCREEYIS
jgi:hypothetical protein